MSLISNIALLAGEGNAAAARIVVWNSGLTDAGTPINPRVRWQRLLPAGLDGESCFTAVIVAATWRAAGSIQVTVRVDGQALPMVTVALASPGPDARTQTFYVPLTVPVVGQDGVTPIARRYPRGAWVEVELNLPAAGGTGLRIDGVELEHELMRRGTVGAGVAA